MNSPSEKLQCSSHNQFFWNFLESSQGKQNLIKSDVRSDFVTKIFTNLLKNNNVGRSSRITSLGAVFAGMFNRTMRDLPKKPVFQKGDGTWIDILHTKTKYCNNRTQSSTKLTTFESFFSEKNEGFVYQKLFDRRKITKKYNRRFS